MTRILAHLDDVGATEGSVAAWKALRTAGVVRSASVMVPCPWYPLARDDWRDTPEADTGLHITLTSEWDSYRWRPLNGPGGGVVDDEGFFHRRPAMVLASADRRAVADEMAAQLDRVLADGLRPTHLDAHMGTALLDPFVWDLIALGREHDIPVLACRELAQLIVQVGAKAPDAGFVAEVIAEVEAQGWPVFDRFLIGFCPDDQGFPEFLAELLAGASGGLDYYAMHADTAHGMDAFAPHHTGPRRKEFEAFRDAASVRAFDDVGARLVTWGDLSN